MALYRFGYRFNMFEFDSPTGELVKEGCWVRLRPQPARALEHLLERHGQLVSRGELQRAIWPEGTFVHFDHGLNSCVKQIRAAIGDRRAAPRYIETLVKRGFRFVAPVMIVSPKGHAGVQGGLGRRAFMDRSLRSCPSVAQRSLPKSQTPRSFRRE